MKLNILCIYNTIYNTGVTIMNIFFLSESPTLSAIAQTDKHVVKMALESAQLLCTAHRVLDGKETIRLSKNNRKLKYWEMADEELESTLYKPTHYNHPCSIWVRESAANYNWLLCHWLSLCAEYEKRFGKVHATFTKLYDILEVPPKNISLQRFTQPCKAMPDQYVKDGVCESYINYYKSEKLKTEKDIARFNKIIVQPKIY